MSQEAIRLEIYRRANGLLVSAWVIADTWRSLPGIIAVEPGPDGLAHALERGEREARDVTASRPRSERVLDGVPYWEAAGYPIWEDFIKNTSLIAIWRMNGLTELKFEEIDERCRTHVIKELTRKLEPGASMTDVARAAMEMFAAADQRSPR